MPVVCGGWRYGKRSDSRVAGISIRYASGSRTGFICKSMGSCVRRGNRARGLEDQGYREAKAVMAFSQADVAEVSKERHELLAKVLKAQITDSEAFRSSGRPRCISKRRARRRPK